MEEYILMKILWIMQDYSEFEDEKLNIKFENKSNDEIQREDEEQINYLNNYKNKK